MTINERIKEIRRSSGLSQTDFAERLGTTRGVITNLEGEKTSPNEPFIKLICREFSVSLAWLEDGEGEMYVQRSENERMALMFTDVLAEADESIRKRGIAAALEMPPEFWDSILEYAKKITGSK